MKKLILKFWAWLFPKQALKQVNRGLERAVYDQKVNQIKLMVEIKDFIVKDLKIDRSKFIPLSVRQQVCNKVISKYGDGMKAHRIKINTNLQLVKL